MKEKLLNNYPLIFLYIVLLLLKEKEKRNIFSWNFIGLAKNYIWTMRRGLIMNEKRAETFQFRFIANVKVTFMCVLIICDFRTFTG